MSPIGRAEIVVRRMTAVSACNSITTLPTISVFSGAQWPIVTFLLIPDEMLFATFRCTTRKCTARWRLHDPASTFCVLTRAVARSLPNVPTCGLTSDFIHALNHSDALGRIVSIWAKIEPILYDTFEFVICDCQQRWRSSRRRESTMNKIPGSGFKFTMTSSEKTLLLQSDRTLFHVWVMTSFKHDDSLPISKVNLHFDPREGCFYTLKYSTLLHSSLIFIKINLPISCST